MSHIKEVEFRKNRNTYSLEVDTEDPDNLVIESVTLIDSKNLRDNEREIDPDIFQEELDIDDWQAIKERLNR